MGILSLQTQLVLQTLENLLLPGDQAPCSRPDRLLGRAPHDRAPTIASSTLLLFLFLSLQNTCFGFLPTWSMPVKGREGSLQAGPMVPTPPTSPLPANEGN